MQTRPLRERLGGGIKQTLESKSHSETATAGQGLFHATHDDESTPNVASSHCQEHPVCTSAAPSTGIRPVQPVPTKVFRKL